MSLKHQKATPWVWCVVFATALIWAGGCSEDNNDTANTTTDTTSGTGDTAGDVSDTSTGEVLVIGDDLSGGNDTTSGVNEILEDAWPLNDVVETAAQVTITENGGVFSAEIDAAAGGLDNSASHAFIYLDLDAGEKLAINDFEAISTNKTWDLAFKRTVIRSNGADSGPGDIQVARITGETFDSITAVPGDLIFAQDVAFDVDGNLLTDPIGAPKTAFNYINTDTSSGSWYDYGAGISAIAGHVYIIQDSKTSVSFKFEIISWASGQYSVRWAKL